MDITITRMRYMKMLPFETSFTTSLMLIIVSTRKSVSVRRRSRKRVWVRVMKTVSARSFTKMLSLTNMLSQRCRTIRCSAVCLACSFLRCDTHETESTNSSSKLNTVLTLLVIPIEIVIQTIITLHDTHAEDIVEEIEYAE